jgi:hypothetical protein
MADFQIPSASLATAAFPEAQAMAIAVSTVLTTNNAVNSYLPQAMATRGNDDTTTAGLTSSSAIYFTDGTINANTYLNLVTSLQNLRSSLASLPVFSGVAASDLRIVFTDSTKSVAFDSSKLGDSGASYTVVGNQGDNTTLKALAKLYSSTNINECHVGRVEFTAAELSANRMAINRRWSGTLKRLEDRVVFALKYGNKVTGLLAISKPA